MADKNLILTIVAEQAFIRNTNKKDGNFVENEILFNAISNTYLPLLNMFNKLENEGVPFKIALVMSAPLCTLLSDPEVQMQYLDFLDCRIALGEKELSRNGSSKEILATVEKTLEKAKQDKIDFTEKYNSDILSALRQLSQKGLIELIATAATYSYLPHYADLTEALNAQIETGLYAQRHFFGETGEGFYLPYLGWAKGFEKVLRSYGINYTIVDTRSFLFTQEPVSTGIFAPLRTANSLVLFARDNETPEDISSEEGYASKEPYLNLHKDIGFDLPQSDLVPFLTDKDSRVATGYKYYANGEDEDDEVLYNLQDAMDQVKADALDFYEKKAYKLLEAEKYMGEKNANLVCTIPAELLGQNWAEGVEWLENVIRIIAEKNEIQLNLCKNLISDQFTLPKIVPYPCSASGTGYGEDMVDSNNSWMLRYIRKATERMIDLTDRFPSETGLKARLLNLGAKEILLAQSGDWPKMVTEKNHPDYATEAYKKNIISFTTVFDSLASSTVSTEWLTNLEKEHTVFPWLNYRVFSRKK